MQNIENPLYQKDISPIFLQKVEYVRKRIFDNCAPKKGFSGGSIVSGFRTLYSFGLSNIFYGPCCSEHLVVDIVNVFHKKLPDLKV